MHRYLTVVVIALLAVVSLSAQATQGWKVRIDRSTNASDPDASGNVKFVAESGGFHATNPQAAVYWNPGNSASGTYTLRGTFTLLEPSNHNNYYGIVFGGKNLDAATQSYVYFTVSQNGTWLLKQRQGDNTQTIAQQPSEAIKKPDAGGKSTNVLEVRVAADKVDYVVNGTTVHSTPKSALAAGTDGLFGMRVNHFLNVQMSPIAKS